MVFFPNPHAYNVIFKRHLRTIGKKQHTALLTKTCHVQFTEKHFIQRETNSVGAVFLYSLE